jgi:radical S-adenosyl methionine domain-containing protein 2
MNLDENFTNFVRCVSPDRWKLLKMKSFHNEAFDNSSLEITEQEFWRFASVYAEAGIPHVPEMDLVNSYILVDAAGNLLDNSGEQYRSVANLLTEDFCAAFKQLPFNEEMYRMRY